MKKSEQAQEISVVKGVCWLKPTKQTSAREVWERTYGRVPDGYQVARQCKNNLCFNPAHLFIAVPGDVVRHYRTKHGKSHDRAYDCWSAMVQRCTNPKHPEYFRYGGRGITVCERWLRSFSAFYEDMGEQEPGLSLDRVDNNQGYSKENCRWATSIQQANNHSANHLLHYAGRVQTLTEWARELGLKPTTLEARLSRLGMSVEEALSTPVRKAKVKGVYRSGRRWSVVIRRQGKAHYFGMYSTVEEAVSAYLAGKQKLEQEV